MPEELDLQHTQEALVVPGTGEVVDLRDENQCATALAEIREFEAKLGYTKRILTDAIAERSKVEGSKTLHLKGGRKAVVSGWSEWQYDALALMDNLREAGMPEERISEIVEETVSYKVKAGEATRAANANEKYAGAIDASRELVTKPYSVTIGAK